MKTIFARRERAGRHSTMPVHTVRDDDGTVGPADPDGGQEALHNKRPNAHEIRVQCGQCEREISAAEEVCPHCHTPQLPFRSGY